MNGLNSPASHVGVDSIVLLAEIIVVLEKLSCDWPGGFESMGVFYRWWMEVGYFVTLLLDDISLELPWL